MIRTGYQLLLCPYCGTELKQKFLYGRDHAGSEYQFASCYPEDGGCDREFVVKLVVAPVEVQVLAIEGQGDE